MKKDTAAGHPGNCTFHDIQNRTRPWVRYTSMLALLAMLAFLSGCASFFHTGKMRSGVSSSVVDYLYPTGTRFEPAQEGTPEIKLPARVGLMFVPSRQQPIGVTATDKQALLNTVREAFRAQSFIDRIEIIPETYAHPGGGFENLEQVARLHGVDIIALVSYDQIMRTEDTAASLLYWTIVGAYTIPANRNQVSTFVETAVFDVKTHTLLFRAPGVDQRQGNSTAIRIDDVKTRLAGESFKSAIDNMTANLDQSIADFGKRVIEEGQVRLVDRRSGREWHRRSGGIGSMGLWELSILCLAGMLLLRRR